MGKTRVYELAKELGLENKQVLDLCTDLGIEGKASHSNSLSDDEADRIRRSVIRQAVSGERGAKEIMIDGEPGLEQRKGNIIRRRKRTEDEAKSEEEEESTASLDLSDVPDSKRFTDSSPDLQAQRSERMDALAAANALFGAKGAEAEAHAPEESPEEEVVASHEETAAAVLEEDAAAQTEAVSEEVEAAAVEQETSEDEAAEAESREASLEEARKRHDVRAPKVLGRIELPQKQAAPAAPSASKRERPAARAKSEDESFDGEPVQDASRGPRKKGRRTGTAEGEDFDSPKRKRLKQVLRKADLLDYESDRDNWRKGRDKKSRKGKGDSILTAQQMQPTPETKASKKVVKIEGEISVGEFAKSMGVKVGDLMKELMNLGVMVTINHLIDFETASIVAGEFGFTTLNTGHDEDEFVKSLRGEDADESLVSRPPVVTVMGHVDHGKTSLLDAIRKTSVTENEAGGITQHIGAYNVRVPSGGSVTFIDTPGHEAFTAMRSRGAKVTDVVVLVVAADDGVMPQTIEAINHAKAAEVPIIVAINKIDKEDANIDRIRNQLAEYELIPEDWGGTTIMVPVSAMTREGLPDLLENLHLQAEILELKANPERNAFGVVVESTLDRGRGPVITVLVQNGTLRKGDSFLAGSVTGRVRALVADDGTPVEEAGPGIPVEVLGSSSTPEAGTEFYVVNSESEARAVADHRAQRRRKKELASKGGISGAGPLSLERFSEMVKEGELKDLPIIIKADVGGSLEAVREQVGGLSNEEVQVKIIHSGVGAVTENDVQLASASNAIVVGFNVRASSRAREMAEDLGIDLRFFRVIYELVDSLNQALKGMLAPVIKEKTLGRVEVRQTFRVPKLGTVAGSYVIDGMVERGALVRLLRDDAVVYEGKMASLRRFKEDVKEVQSGYECGIGIEGYSDIKDGDIIEVYKLEEVRPT
ncbi:MAG: translation initiation factor IF-2 [Bdellovibrionales bacterium]|nr:translation initiation factor IF-2 [Bdellovibrionales bacterium]